MGVFSPNDFRAQLQGDGARPNLFQIQVAFPALVSPGNAARKLTFMARATHLPGQTLGITPVFYQGREIKLAGNRTLPDWNFTVINDTDFSIRNAFERWLVAINSIKNNVRNGGMVNLAAYSSVATVRQFNQLEEVIKEVNIYGWPHDISQIDLDWSANDTLEEFTINWVTNDMDDPTNGVV